jgi:hypothetical protein
MRADIRSGQTFMIKRFEAVAPNGETEFDMPEADVVEIPLLLAGWQVSALETAAHDRGLTAAEMVRHVLRDFLSHAGRHASTCSSSAFGSMSTRS